TPPPTTGNCCQNLSGPEACSEGPNVTQGTCEPAGVFSAGDTCLPSGCSQLACGTYILSIGNLPFSSADGPFKIASAVAVDSSGNVFVSDQLNNRVQKFDSNGNFLMKWSGSMQAGNFGALGGVAVDPTTDNVYVADNDNSIIQVFDDSGAYITSWGSFGT